jgi:tRNA1Val (adenine37-N6)-methyltransferase
MESNSVFRFKQFSIAQDKVTMKVGTDGVLLGGWCHVDGVQHTLDIGSGTGVIGLMVAQRSLGVHVVCIDVDQSAYEQCAQNISDSVWSDRMQSLHLSAQEYKKEESKKFDLIVSNPPFFTGGTLSETGDRNDVRHTTKLSHSDLLQAVDGLMTDQGRFELILPQIEGLRFIELAENYHMYASQITEVRTRANRKASCIIGQTQS